MFSFFDVTLILSVLVPPLTALGMFMWALSRPLPLKQRLQLGVIIICHSVSFVSFSAFVHSFLLPETSASYEAILSGRWTYFILFGWSFFLGFYGSFKLFKNSANARKVFPWFAH